MEKTLPMRHCSPSCDLRKVCHAETDLPRTRALGTQLQRYCQHTRWWVIGGIAAAWTLAVAVYASGGLA